MASFSVLTAFWIIKTSQVKERSKEEKQAKRKWRKQMTAAAVFLRTFGALTKVYFLYAIYHFKAQEVKNPTLQTVYDLELKWGRHVLRKTTAPGLCEIRTTPWNSHNTFSLCEACAKFTQHLPNSHSPCVVRIFLYFCRLHFRSFPMYLFYVISFLILVTSQSQALLL